LAGRRTKVLSATRAKLRPACRARSEIISSGVDFMSGIRTTAVPTEASLKRK